MRPPLLIVLGALLLCDIASAEPAGCSPKPGKPMSRWVIKTSIVNPVNDPIPLDLGMLIDWDNPPIDTKMRKQMLTGRLARQRGAEVKEGQPAVRAPARLVSVW